jgi:hypothetical protein
MNTNQLKKFAKEARIKLITQIGVKLDFVLTQDTADLRGKSSEVGQLRSKLNELGREQLIETVAYTWFNRLMALRFMDANGYNTPKVVTPLPGMSNPEILQNALAGNIEDDLKLDRQRLNDLIDGRTSSSDAQTEAFKSLLVASCNKWHTAMPFMFEKISDYTELLIPDDLLSDFSVVSDIRDGMSDDDCQHEELIGWLYQFYISDKKDEVFEDLSKNIKIISENLPAATQLFTPNWIVRYMVENTLGRLWLSVKPESKIRNYMPFYIEESAGNNNFNISNEIKNITEISFLDPCQGSGHVLVYAFELFTKIYEEEGYNTNEIPTLILEKNLFGIDIDNRAAQLAAFSLTMKSRRYYTRYLKKTVQPNVIALENISENIISNAVKLPFAVDGKLIYDYRDLTLFNLTNAKNYGSLIQIDPNELKALHVQKGSIWQDQEVVFKNQAEYLSRQYSCVVTNPPYVGARNMNTELKTWLDQKYKEASNDLFSSFIVRANQFAEEGGLVGLITLHGWMFISTFEPLRRWMLNKLAFHSLVHIGGNSFPTMNSQIARAVSFVYQRKIQNEKTSTICYDLDSVKNSHSIDKELLFRSRLNEQNYITKDFEKFNKIESFTFLYSISSELLEIFISNKTIGEIAKPRQGLATGNNAIFVRNWFEIDFGLIGFNKSNWIDFDESNAKYVPYNKGGKFRRWYGNNFYVLKFDKYNQDLLSKQGNHLPSRTFYFKEGLTYGLIGNTSFCARKFGQGYLFDVGGSSIFSEPEFEYILLGLVNSYIGSYLLSKLNPTINFQVGDVSNIPFVVPPSEIKIEIENYVKNCIELAKNEQQFFEENYEFDASKYKLNSEISLHQNLINLVKFAKNEIGTLYQNERRLNQIYSKIYQIGDFKDDSEISITVNLFGLWKSDPTGINIDEELILNSFISNIISLGIGCILGRYSMSQQGFVISSTSPKVIDNKNSPLSNFQPDEDNILPVLEDEWFNDDIAGLFKHFINYTYGSKFYSENINFIEERLGKEIRKYLVKDFYNDHVKRYKKTPIYWMFSSPKGHFKALIYMHRYQPDLCSKMLNDYLQPFISKLEAAKQTNTLLALRVDVTAREKTIALKEVDRLELMIRDCKDYERTLFTIATQKITIDLDDGVKINYLKFKDVLVPIKGLEKEED